VFTVTALQPQDYFGRIAAEFPILCRAAGYTIAPVEFGKVAAAVAIEVVIPPLIHASGALVWRQVGLTKSFFLTKLPVGRLMEGVSLQRSMQELAKESDGAALGTNTMQTVADIGWELSQRAGTNVVTAAYQAAIAADCAPAVGDNPIRLFSHFYDSVGLIDSVRVAIHVITTFADERLLYTTDHDISFGWSYLVQVQLAFIRLLPPSWKNRATFTAWLASNSGASYLPGNVNSTIVQVINGSTYPTSAIVKPLTRTADAPGFTPHAGCKEGRVHTKEFMDVALATALIRPMVDAATLNRYDTAEIAKTLGLYICAKPSKLMKENFNGVKGSASELIERRLFNLLLQDDSVGAWTRAGVGKLLHLRERSATTILEFVGDWVTDAVPEEAEDESSLAELNAVLSTDDFLLNKFAQLKLYCNSWAKSIAANKKAHGKA